MTDGPKDPTEGHPPGEEEQMRAAYEAELARITSTEMILQTTVSLLNIGGRRLGLQGPASPQAQSAGERDLEQVRDAIDGARALMPILERRISRELGPLRDALAQLQMAYAREARVGDGGATQTPPSPPESPAAPGNTDAPAPGAAPGAQKRTPGPAEVSGRLWVPGR
jgi:hypothetical protein